MDVFIICQINIKMFFIHYISMLMIKCSILKTDTHGLHTNIVCIYIYIYIYILQQTMFLI